MRQDWRYDLAAIIVIALSFLNTSSADAQCAPCLNPGIKAGYTFGEKFGEGGSFIVGFELSITKLEIDYRKSTFGGPMVGGVFDWDISTSNGRQKFHVGVETATISVLGSLGVDFGPSLVFQPSNGMHLGVTMTPFFGLVLYPYYSITYYDGTIVQELGSYIKVPITTTGQRP